MQMRSLFTFAASSPVKLDEFMPSCLKHVEDLLAVVDSAYTDAQLGAVLKQECLRAHEIFPKSSDPTGFADEATCSKLADALHKARQEELKTGKKDAYEEWCEDYYATKTKAEPLKAAKPAEPEPEPKKASSSFASGWSVALLALPAAGFAVAAAYCAIAQ